MAYKISLRAEHSPKRLHNIRDPHVVSKEEHINPDGLFEIWHDEEPRKAYDRLFSKAVEDYNAKQTRSDRLKGNYYDEVLKYQGEDKKPWIAYEQIIQIGNKENRVDDALGREIMKQFVDEWKQRNPAIELIGAYYHADEEGAPHVHIDYIPVGTGYQKGLSTRNSLSKALSSMGFKNHSKKHDLRIQWQEKERNYLAELCKSKGLDIDQTVSEYRKHIDTKTYKAIKNIEQLIGELEQQNTLKNDLKAQIDVFKNTLVEIQGLTFKKPNKTILKRPEEITIPYEEYKTLYYLATKQENLDKERNEAHLKAKQLNLELSKQKEITQKINDFYDNYKNEVDNSLMIFMKSIKNKNGQNAWELFNEQQKKLEIEKHGTLDDIIAMYKNTPQGSNKNYNQRTHEVER